MVNEKITYGENVRKKFMCSNVIQEATCDVWNLFITLVNMIGIQSEQEP